MKIRTFKITTNILFSLLVLGLCYVQIVKAPLYIKLSKNNRIRVVPLPAPRGNIFDRDGNIIVGNRISFNCTAIPQELIDKDKTLSALSQILGVSKETLEKRLRKDFINPFTPVTLAKDISKSTAIAIEEERLSLSGIFVSIKPIRDYIYKDAYAHLVGYIGEIDKGELDRLDRYGYRITDLIGKSGIEKEYDNYLKGKNGGMQIEVDSRGRQIRVLGLKEAVKGNDIYTTIDIELQKYINEILDEKEGACIVMNPSTGEILSLVSKPSFDPNLFVNGTSDVRRILRDKQYPMLNRGISGVYPPGSSFKVVIATGALEERKINTKKEFVCTGRHKVGGKIFHCWKEEGHGPQNIIDGIKNSCNVFFYNIGVLLGPDAISRCAKAFGFGRPSGIDLPAEAAGLVPNKLWKRLKTGARWYDGETANYAIGQGYLLVTPIQILRMISATANGGFLVEPHIVRRIESVDVLSKVQREIGISHTAVEIVKKGLHKVVQDDSGTGIRARVEGLSIAGKTGTAQTSGGTTHAWFTGFSPAENPKIALVVFLEEGGKGGLSASLLAGQIFKKAKELGLL